MANCNKHTRAFLDQNGMYHTSEFSIDGLVTNKR